MDIGKGIGLQYGDATRDAFGRTLAALGRENHDLVVVDGDLSNSTRTEYFAGEYPDRCFNVGIAESNMVGIASGLAACRKKVVAASFSCFLMCNAYDQIRMGIALPQLPVKLVGSHSGISVGEDGPSQMAIEDIALATSLPHFTVLVPADAPSTEVATRAMFEVNGPVYLRCGRPKVPIVYSDGAYFKVGAANLLHDGNDVAIIACGLMVAAALEAADELKRKSCLDARVIDMHTIKPIDVGIIKLAAEETNGIVCAEEHVLDGGLGSAVARVVAQTHPVPMEFVGLRNTYAESGDPEDLLRKYGLMPYNIVEAAHRVMSRSMERAERL